MKSLIHILFFAALAFYTLPLSASEVSQEDIVCKLDPKCAKPLTRSLTRGGYFERRGDRARAAFGQSIRKFCV